MPIIYRPQTDLTLNENTLTDESIAQILLYGDEILTPGDNNFILRATIDYFRNTERFSQPFHNTNTHKHTLTHTLKHTHTHSHKHTHTNTHTYTHRHTHTQPHTLSHTHSHSHTDKTFR